jgi:hypothetical protein
VEVSSLIENRMCSNLELLPVINVKRRPRYISALKKKVVPDISLPKKSLHYFDALNERDMKFKPLVIWIWNQNIAISTIIGTSSHIIKLFKSRFKRITISDVRVMVFNILIIGGRLDRYRMVVVQSVHTST